MVKKSKNGREFELLIERIEKILAPKGAVIKSPDYISDLITGSPREVDISIRFQDENENRLITIECRDRIGQQDTTWIEQLVTKQKDIGAWQTYAVSSGKFSKPAIEKAKHYGIEIRQFDKITDAEIAQEWAYDSSRLNIELIKPNISLVNFKVPNKNKNALDINNIPNELIETLKNDLLIINPLDFSSISDLQQINNWLTESNNIEEAFHISLSFNYQLESKSAKNIESDVVANYLIKRQIINMPIKSVQQYSSPKETITQFIEGETSNDDYTFKFNLRGRFKPIPIIKRQSKDVKKTTKSKS